MRTSEFWVRVSARNTDKWESGEEMAGGVLMAVGARGNICWVPTACCATRGYSCPCGCTYDSEPSILCNSDNLYETQKFVRRECTIRRRLISAEMCFQRLHRIWGANSSDYLLGYNAMLATKHSLLANFFMLVSCLAYSSTLNMEETCLYETSFNFQQTIQCYIPEDRTLQFHQ
jgi:hypothetical protein